MSRRTNFVIRPKPGAAFFSADELVQAMKRVKLRHVGPLLKEMRRRLYYVKPGQARRLKSRRARVKLAKIAKRQQAASTREEVRS